MNDSYGVRVGMESEPVSSIQIVPVISPLPFKE
jgi:hypothetical protein